MPTTEYEGHTITVGDNMRFQIRGPMVTQWEDSFAEAKAAIDKAKAKAKEAQRVKLGLPVLDYTGAPKTITGVHAKNFSALGLGDATLAYPRAPFLQALLVEAHNIRQRLQNINSLIRPYQIETAPYVIAADSAASRITEDHKEKTERAEKKQAEIDAEKKSDAA